jgi:hypothetical protein
MNSTHSQSALPDYPFTVPERRTLRIVDGITPLSHQVPSQPTRPPRDIRKYYTHSLPVSIAVTIRKQAPNFLGHPRINQRE